MSQQPNLCLGLLIDNVREQRREDFCCCENRTQLIASVRIIRSLRLSCSTVSPRTLSNDFAVIFVDERSIDPSKNRKRSSSPGGCVALTARTTCSNQSSRMRCPRYPTDPSCSFVVIGWMLQRMAMYQHRTPLFLYRQDLANVSLPSSRSLSRQKGIYKNPPCSGC